MISPVARTLAVLVTSVFGLAVLSVILSKQANTTAVINAGSTGLAGVITAATAPISGGSSYQYGGGMFG